MGRFAVCYRVRAPDVQGTSSSFECLYQGVYGVVLDANTFDALADADVQYT